MTKKQLALPTIPRSPSTTDPQSLLIYGPPKVGKTSALGKLPGNQIAMLEHGGGAHCPGLFTDLEDLDQLNQWFNLVQEAGSPFATIDSFSVLQEWLVDWANTEWKKSPAGRLAKEQHIFDLPMGKGYSYLWDAVRHTMEVFKRCSPHVILVCHMKDKFIYEVEGREVVGKEIDAIGKVANILASSFSAIGVMRRGRKDELILSFRTSEQTNCGARAAHLKGQEFVLATKDDEEPNWAQIFTQLNTQPQP